MFDPRHPIPDEIGDLPVTLQSSDPRFYRLYVGNLVTTTRGAAQGRLHFFSAADTAHCRQSHQNQYQTDR